MKTYEERINSLVTSLKEYDNIVFFTGAGVSVESGIPDFRGAGGLYTTGNNIEYKLSYKYLTKNARKFYPWYAENIVEPMEGKQPNDAHKAIAELEKLGKNVTVITQNIDGLHQMAGSTNVLEMHGRAQEWFCKNPRCRHKVSNKQVSKFKDDQGVPRCPNCGKQLRPAIILYGESLSDDLLYDATVAVGHADVLVICGTSLTVTPVAYMPQRFFGYDIFVINQQETYLDKNVQTLCIFRESVGQVLKDAVEKLKE